MNKKQLLMLGVPADCVKDAIAAVQVTGRNKELENPKTFIPKIVAAPEVYLSDNYYGEFAKALIAERETGLVLEPIEYQVWGDDLDEHSHQQIRNACQLPISRAAALMPDAHSGYGLPIGGVLACENAIVPYGVGVDIACRMKLSVTDLPIGLLEKNDSASCRELDLALKKGTMFGTGRKWDRPFDHDVLDEDWTVTAVTREVRDRAVGQLGTSGSGNHFVEWGLIKFPEGELGLEAGTYVALLSHSGSRGPGARVCQRYTDIARRLAPSRIRDDKQLRHLAWLEMDSEPGQEYWAAMNLMGRYAAANHEIIHENVTRIAGARRIGGVENHHNFAWLETHGGQELYVHRKGATPASEGELGVIPGTMADSCFIVRGKGNSASLRSAAHGAGRRMSRTAAKRSFIWSEGEEH